MTSSSSANHRVGGTVADKYVVERQLGEGGMGSVYLAHHVLTGRRVALKWVPTADGTSRERVLREARAMGRLEHPNVVGVLDVGEEDDAIFMVLEYVHGQNLRRYAGGRRFAPGEALDLLLPALSGVAAAHQAEILHRDLKPENLFVCLDADGTPFDTKVLDFGVAKQLSEADDEVSLTQRGAIIGTPRYMAPEQIAAEPTLTPAADVYALALIFYELLTGELPYSATSLRDLALEILRGQLASPAQLVPGLPEGLCRVVMKALANDAPNRYPDVASFARALEPWAGQRRFEPPREAHTPQPGLGGDATTEVGTPRPRPGAPTVQDPSPQDLASGVRGAPTEQRGRRELDPAGEAGPPAAGAATVATPRRRPVPAADASEAQGHSSPYLLHALIAALLVGLGLLFWLLSAAPIGKPATGAADAPDSTPAAVTPSAATPTPASAAAPVPDPAAAQEPNVAPAVATPSAPSTQAQEPRTRVRSRPRSTPATPASTTPAAPPGAAAPRSTVEGRSGTFDRKDF